MKRKELSELSALNREARERHVSYGQLVAATSEKERRKIIYDQRKRYDEERAACEESGKRKRRKEFDADRFVELYEAGLTDLQIAQEMGISRYMAFTYRHEMGLKSKRSNVLAGHYDTVMKLYRAGKNDREIAEAIGVSDGVICEFRNKRGMPANRKRGEDKRHGC